MAILVLHLILCLSIFHHARDQGQRHSNYFAEDLRRSLIGSAVPEIDTNLRLEMEFYQWLEPH